LRALDITPDGRRAYRELFRVEGIRTGPADRALAAGTA